MRANHELPIMAAGERIGLLIVQDTGDFEPWPNLAELCHKVATAVAQSVDAYGASPLPWVVTIRMGGEEEARVMNHEFRHKDYATNVLSFPSDDDAEEGDEERYMGDIFICMQVVRKEAAEQHKNPDHHLTHMMLHGLLHLVGYDHEEEDQAKAMEAIETDILTSLGLPAPYEEAGA